MSAVFVVGSANVDRLWRVDRMPVIGETVLATASDRMLGGKGANQAVSAARAGADVRFLACVGEDAGGRFAHDALGTGGVDVTDVVALPGVPTGEAVVVLAGSDNLILVHPGANAAFPESELARLSPSAGDIVLCQLEIPLPVVGEAFRIARGSGARTVLNAAPMTELGGLIALTDVLVVNESEYAELAGTDAPMDAIPARLSDRGFAGVLVVTAGRHGVHVVGPGGAETLAALRVAVVDTSGAGDCFLGYLVAGLARGESLSEATRFANAAAALSVTRPGTSDSIPARSEVEAFRDSIPR